MKIKLLTMLVAGCMSLSALAQDNALYSYLCQRHGNTESYQLNTTAQAKTLVVYPGDGLQTASVASDNNSAWIKAHVKPEQLPQDCLSYFLSQGYWQQGKGLARFHFQFNSTQLNAEDKLILTRVLAVIQNIPNVRVVGHTDKIGSNAYNQKLGYKRAETVTKSLLLQANNIKLTTSSRGETQPLSHSDSANGRALNRRVEVVLEDNAN